jgi:tripartite-type tricarboxylate transporter receptor subunit TctC
MLRAGKTTNRGTIVQIRRWFMVGAVLLAAGGANAQGWPERNVTILVPFAAGSTPDIIARVLGDGLQAKLGKPFLIENRPGASGNTATAAVAKAQPDGHTLGVSIVGPLVINPLIMSTVPYDPDRDLAPISIVASQPNVVAVHPDLGVSTVQELIQKLKANPGKYNYGSIGKGSLSHLSMEAILARSGTRAAHVVFAGSPAAVTALVRGDVQMASLVAGAIVPQAQAGKVKMIAVPAAKRTPLLPDVPTMAEGGVPGVEADAWVGLIAPAGTPQTTLSRILDETRSVLATKMAEDRLRPAFMVPVGSTTEQFRALLKAERNLWEPVIKAGKIKVD